KSQKAKAKRAKETYVDDPEQVHVATLLSVESERLRLERIEREQRMIDEEINDDLDDTLEAMKTQNMKGELSDSLDSDQTLSATRLDVVDEGDEDDASNFTVLVHEKTMVSKEKRTPILTTISSLRTQSSQDNISCYLNENPAPSLEMDEFITHKIPAAVQESVSAKVIKEVKNHAPTLVRDAVADIVRSRLHKVVSHVLRTEQITLTFSPALSSTNIIIPQLKETLYEMMTNNPDSIIRDINTELYIALSKSVNQDKQVVPKDSYKKANLKKRTHDDQDPPVNHEGRKYTRSQDLKTRDHPRWFAGPPAKYTDYLWVTRSDAEDRFHDVFDTYPDPDELEDKEMVPDNSTLSLAKRIKRCLKVEKLNLSKMEEFRKNGYKLFVNRYMSKAEYDYNMDQMKIAMSDHMDWEIDHGFGVNIKEPLPLIGPKFKGKKYALSVTKCHAAEYKCEWIEEDIGKLFRKTLVNYDMDAMLGNHHWEKKRLAYRGKRSATSPEKVYSDFKFTFVDEVIVDDLYEYVFLESITVRRADKKKYTFKESDFSQLNLNDIEDILIIKKRVKDVQLGVESYQKSLDIIKPHKRFLKIEHYPTYTTCPKPFRVVYKGVHEVHVQSVWLEMELQGAQENYEAEGFAAALAVLKPERLKVDKARNE
nr:hypothetical protein [Tanacetum cinerariifolium]